MKTRTLIQKIKELGFNTHFDSKIKKVDIFRYDGTLLGQVKTDEKYILSTGQIEFAELEDDIKSTIFAMLVDYVLTPIEERGEDPIDWSRYYEEEDELD